MYTVYSETNIFVMDRRIFKTYTGNTNFRNDGVFANQIDVHINIC